MFKAITTQEQFDRLPMLLTYGEVIACGVSRRRLKDAVDQGTVAASTAPHKARRRYPKSQIAVILGLR